MIVSEEDARRINEILLTGWKTREDHFKGWASQEVRTGQITQGIQDERSEERPEEGGEHQDPPSEGEQLQHQYQSHVRPEQT
jgi:hypothetical protein